MAQVELPLIESSFDVPLATYPQFSKVTLPTSHEEIQEIAEKTITNLNKMLTSKNYSSLTSLMLGNSYWRDHLGLSTTKFQTFRGPQEVVEFIKSTNVYGNCLIKRFALEESKEPTIENVDPKGILKSIQAFITFSTEEWIGRGLFRLVQDVEDGDRWKIYTMYTGLSELNDFHFRTGKTRPWNAKPENCPENKNWKEYKEDKQKFEKEEPTVLVVGAGHSGIMTAARLEMLGVPTLIIDQGDRVGDSWRNRYSHLTLHDPCHLNVMPYLPYPPNWPLYAPKDRIADFLEHYITILDLTVWNKTTIIESTWQEDKKQWKVVLESGRSGAKVRSTYNPKHVVQAAGLNGEPRIPEFPGMNNFEGESFHTSQFTGATSKYAGKKVIIVGAGNSAHDIAHDITRNGGHVTMVQRSSTFVITIPATRMLISARYDEDKITEDSDLIMASTPTALLKRVNGEAAQLIQAQIDAPLLHALTTAGFRLDTGPHLPSPLPLTIHRAGGLYLDNGCSALIASGRIAIKQGQAITSISAHSMFFADGTEIVADEIIYATGYLPARTRTRLIFGDAVADRIDPIWGFDHMGEIRGVWRRSGQPGFWVAVGSFWISRYYSTLLALQIKAVEVGLVPL